MSVSFRIELWCLVTILLNLLKFVQLFLTHVISSSSSSLAALDDLDRFHVPWIRRSFIIALLAFPFFSMKLGFSTTQGNSLEIIYRKFSLSTFICLAATLILPYSLYVANLLVLLLMVLSNYFDALINRLFAKLQDLVRLLCLGEVEIPLPNQNPNNGGEDLPDENIELQFNM